MSVLILTLLGTIYYQHRKSLMLSQHRLAMQLQSESYLPTLRQWMQGDVKAFPRDLAYATALYDVGGKMVASHLQSPVVDLKEPIGKQEGYIHFVMLLSSYEMGDLYLVLETRDDGLWFKDAMRNALVFGALLFTVLLLVGFYLSKLFLRPMKEAIALLDDFIKDTTHELNTPVSAIVSNIEMIETEGLDDKTAKKINRIAIGARTISTIYDDLTYLVLNHELAVSNEPVDMAKLITERLEYFHTRCVQKRLSVEAALNEGVVVIMDRTKATRLIDNLLSNAIKYNRVGGNIFVQLNNRELKIRDTGRGIPGEKLQKVFERYQRADTTVGGFGIGLNIVAMIAKEYGIGIDVDSKEGEGTAITLLWPV